MRNKVYPLVLATWAGLAALASVAVQAQTSELQETAPARALEKPLRKEKVRLPADKEHRFDRVVTCFTYKSALLKQVEAVRNAAILQATVVPVSDSETPKCQEKIPNELALNDAFTFLGKVGKFGVFTDPDPQDTTTFRVIDLNSGKSVFTDSMAQTRLASASSNGDDFELRYQRGFKANCSMVKSKSACWKQITNATGLAATPVPECGTGLGLSVVGYPVITMMVDGRATTLALPGTISCAPER